MKKLIILLGVLLISGAIAGQINSAEQSSGDMNPQVIGNLDLSDIFLRVNAIKINGNFALVSGWKFLESGKREDTSCLLDISNPSNPKVLPFDKDLVKSNFGSTFGNYQYIDMQERGENLKLEILDISDLKNPKSVKILDYLEGDYRQTVKIGNDLIIATGKNSTLEHTKLYRLNIENPADPKLVSSTIIDLQSKEEYSFLPGFLMGFEARGDLLYIITQDTFFVLSVEDNGIYLIDDREFNLDFVNSYTVVEETMDPHSVFVYFAGSLKGPAKFPGEVSPEQYGRDSIAGIETISHSLGDPIDYKGFYIGGNRSFRLPVESVTSIESNKTLAYVIGVDTLTENPQEAYKNKQEIEYQGKMLVVDLSVTANPQIVGSCDLAGRPTVSAQKGDISYTINLENMLQVIKLPTSQKEFNNYTYVGSGYSPSQWDPFNPTTIQPKGIEEALRIQIEKPVGALTSQDFADLKKLEFPAYRLSNLEGIELCKNIEELNLDSNYKLDIKPLAGLSGIKKLNLTRCNIKDLEPLSGLTNLEELVLDSNEFKDITPLLKLPNLKVLDISGNRDVDITPLSKMTGLTSLNIRSTNTQDISFLESFVNLKNLNINNNRINNLEPISNLTKLETLDISSTYVEDLSALKSLKNLKDLRAGRLKITDISFLKDHGKLELLSLRENRIKDLSPLSQMVNLTELYLSENQISDISPLKGLIKIETLNLSDNEISDVRPLENLVNLKERLSLSKNKVKNINGLEKLTQLEELNLDGNQIGDISPVSSLKNLKTLGISQNQITDLKPIESLGNLTFLNADANQISDLTPVARYKNPLLVELSKNQITDINPLLQDIVPEKVVILDENPLSDESKQKSIPKLTQTSLIVGPNQVEERCTDALINYLACSNDIKKKSLKDTYGTLQDVIDANMASPETKYDRMIQGYNIAYWNITPSSANHDGTKIESTMTLVAVPREGRTLRTFAITEAGFILEWIGGDIPDDFSKVSMNDSKLWKKWPTRFYSIERWE